MVNRHWLRARRSTPDRGQELNQDLPEQESALPRGCGREGRARILSPRKTLPLLHLNLETAVQGNAVGPSGGRR